MDVERPKARKDLDFFPVQSDGKTVIMIQDRLGLVEKEKIITPELYKLMTTLDGTISTRDIQLDLMRQQGGRLIPIEEVQALLDKLDSFYLLDSPRYREAIKEIISDFSALKIRYCSHAGISYPKQEQKLRQRLETILATQQVPSLPDGKITALIAPHIDLEVGKRVIQAHIRQ